MYLGEFASLQNLTCIRTTRKVILRTRESRSRSYPNGLRSRTRSRATPFSQFAILRRSMTLGVVHRRKTHTNRVGKGAFFDSVRGVCFANPGAAIRASPPPIIDTLRYKNQFSVCSSPRRTSEPSAIISMGAFLLSHQKPI